MSSSIENAVRDFVAAESALKTIVEQVETLREAAGRVDIAWAALETAGTAVDRSHGELQALIAALTAAAAALEATSAQARRATEALQAAEPERMISISEETQAEVHKLGTRLQQIIEARTSAVTDTVVASLGSIRSDMTAETSALAGNLDQIRTSMASAEGQIGDIARGQRRNLAMTVVLLVIAVCILAVSLLA